MNKQQFKHMRSQYRFLCREAVRSKSKRAFIHVQNEYPLAARCLQSDRPVSIRVWLKLEHMRSSQEVAA
ncbi:hypothetical protein [Pantoea agglomerans]|uniref:hypothetical protein n=1 Tax=Enterobacter agglomerans TaxID=549 RepID=UPI00177C0F8C|nr:hypothetical protein [Pantoea agglomerans]MBD8155029.1 hypothetical protein [Pantoea agglomerans]